MNILPKKSWHVRTKKNIERVRRDEAEAERKSNLDQQRWLQAEQEARVADLRTRKQVAGCDQEVDKQTGDSKHINLFDRAEAQSDTANRDRLKEQRRDDERWQERVGILNRLVKPADVDRPWYCKQNPLLQDTKQPGLGPEPGGSKQAAALRSDAITSIYDPLITMNHAQEIIKSRRQQQKQLPSSRPQPARSNSYTNTTPPAIEYRSRAQISQPLGSDSSPEIVAEVGSRPRSSTSSIKRRSDNHKHMSNMDNRHKRHKHHRYSPDR